MLRIDGEEFDKMVEEELTKDEECSKLIIQIKESTPLMLNCDDSLVNSLLLKVFEISYQRGFKDGMNFIIDREKNDLFTGSIKIA